MPEDLPGCRSRCLQRCRWRSALELSLDHRTLARTPGGGVLHLHGGRSNVARYGVVHPGGCRGVLERLVRPPGHAGDGAWRDGPRLLPGEVMTGWQSGFDWGGD